MKLDQWEERISDLPPFHWSKIPQKLLPLPYTLHLKTPTLGKYSYDSEEIVEQVISGLIDENRQYQLYHNIGISKNILFLLVISV